MVLDNNILYFLIIGCEIAFWVMLFSGLAVRYLLQMNRLGFYFLACVPLIDLFLFLFALFDLLGGANATFAHGLAAAYIGFTVAFGSTLMSWADKWFAHKFSGGVRPPSEPTHGWAAVFYELKLWGRCILAVLIIYGLLIAVVTLIDDPSRTAELDIWFKVPLFTIFFWFIFGPLWRIVFFKRVDTQNS